MSLGERCYEDLHPGISTTVPYWSVSWPAHASKTPEEGMLFTLIRSAMRMRGKRAAGGCRCATASCSLPRCQDVTFATFGERDMPQNAAQTCGLHAVKRSWGHLGESAKWPLTCYFVVGTAGFEPATP